MLFRSSVLLALIDSGLSRDDAYRVVQEASKRSWTNGSTLRDEILADQHVSIPVATLDAAFDMSRVVSGAQHAVNSLDALRP